MAATQNKLIHQNGTINITLGTLGALNALLAEGSFVSATATFLMKRLRYLISMDGITPGEGPFALVLANGDVTSAEAASAITEGITSGPGDRTQVLTQDNAWNIYQSTLELLTPYDDGAKWMSSGDWISLGKGYPMPETSGWQVFLLNLDSGTLTTGGSLNGIIQYQGVYLGL